MAIAPFCLNLPRAAAKNADFLIQSWQDHDGLPESSALAVAQTPDGFIWVGSNEGLLRFNGVSFLRADKFTDLTRLSGTVYFLHTDRSGRLWAGGEGRMAVLDQGTWRPITGTNIVARSVAEDAGGRVFIGGSEGQLYRVVDGQVKREAGAPSLTRSGVFCVSDQADRGLWLANKGFIGRLSPAGWQRFGPATNIPGAVLAAPARTGGLWVYTPGRLWRFRTGTAVKFYSAPDLDQPREMIEDADGTIWITTISQGLSRFRPGGKATILTATNGLAHPAVRCIIQDHEGNYWVGGSLNGLNRLKRRQFLTIDRDDGLPDNIVRTMTELAPGEVLVGTHGGGIALVHHRTVEVQPPLTPDSEGQYIWSLLQDHAGKLWIGTFNDGLFVQEQGVRHPFPLPPSVGDSIGQLMEDSRGRIWIGSSGCPAVVAGGTVVTCFSNTVLADFATTALLEDTNARAVWLGTYSHGLFRLDPDHLDHITPLADLPGNRITSLTLDTDGYLWIGIFDHGLACLHDGKVTMIGAAQGLPPGNVGSMLDDGLGSFWLGTTRGILRVSREALQHLAQASAASAQFQVFNVSDGLGSDFCTEGYQPNALRDQAGRLWFGTDAGIVTVEPAKLKLNTNPPPVLIENIRFTGRSGNRLTLDPRTSRPVIPPGSADLEFDFDALSFTAPEKVNFKYQLAGANETWVDLGNSRELHFREMAPGHYTLHLAAANNDGIWNQAGATLAFVVQPHVWQTVWFRLLALVAVAGGGGLSVWRLTRLHFQRRIEALQQQRRLEQERARHATVMENTSDLVVFGDRQGNLIHINPSGRKLLGLPPDQDLRGFNLARLFPESAAEKVVQEGIPAAHQHGTWETETVLLRHDGRLIPVSLVLIVHKDAQGGESFVSAIARDITGRKQVEAELQRREKYFRWLTEHASDSITVINPEAVVSYQSNSGERILGYPADAMLGRHLLDLVHPEDLAKVRTALAQTVAQVGVPTSVTARLRHRNGSWRTIQVTGTSSRAENGETQAVLNARDLTDNLELEAQLRQAQKMEAVGQLAGGVAHDFNNILTSLRLQAELMSMNEHLPDGLREGLQQICADTHRAAGLTRQLLLFSRRQVMQLRALDLNQAVMSLARMLQRIIREDVRLQLNLHSKPLMTNADAGMLDQVLINLAVNSRDAMTHGGILRIETSRVTLDAGEARLNPDAVPGQYVCVSVTDTGGGIPVDVVPHIFEPFFTTKEAGRGSGLGLATVFGIVKQHQGWIKLDNRPGDGVTFHIHLPAGTASPTAAPAETKAAPKAGGGSETILLVEDEWAVRMSTRLVLQRHGYKVIEAADGVEALKLWNQHGQRVALLLTDLVMPGGVGGRDLAQQLQGQRPGLKIIFASGYSADIAGRDFQLQNGESFIQKPFVTEKLLETVRHCLDDD